MTEIIGINVAITIIGSLMHLSDFLVRLLNNNKFGLFARYGIGIICIFPVLLYIFNKILIVMIEIIDENLRRRILWALSDAYFRTCVPLGIGVILGHVTEQLLTGYNED